MATVRKKSSQLPVTTLKRKRITILHERYGLGEAISLRELQNLSRDPALSNRDRAEALELLGHIHDNNDDHEKAILAYQRAIELTPGDNRSYKIDLANCLWIHGVEAARSLLQSVKPRKFDPLWMQWLLWTTHLDFATSNEDPPALQKLLKQVPARLRRDPIISVYIRLAKAKVGAIRGR
jgi:cytochrome c-type biogenesis protein CcmH/NrfG